MDYYGACYTPYRPVDCSPVLLSTEYLDCTTGDYDDPYSPTCPVMPISYECTPSYLNSQNYSIGSYGSSLVIPTTAYTNYYPQVAEYPSALACQSGGFVSPGSCSPSQIAIHANTRSPMVQIRANGQEIYSNLPCSTSPIYSSGCSQPVVLPPPLYARSSSPVCVSGVTVPAPAPCGPCAPSPPVQLPPICLGRSKSAACVRPAPCVRPIVLPTIYRTYRRRAPCLPSPCEPCAPVYDTCLPAPKVVCRPRIAYRAPAVCSPRVLRRSCGPELIAEYVDVLDNRAPCVIPRRRYVKRFIYDRPNYNCIDPCYDPIEPCTTRKVCYSQLVKKPKIRYVRKARDYDADYDNGRKEQYYDDENESPQRRPPQIQQGPPQMQQRPPQMQQGPPTRQPRNYDDNYDFDQPPRRMSNANNQDNFDMMNSYESTRQSRGVKQQPIHQYQNYQMNGLMNRPMSTHEYARDRYN